MKRKKKNKNKGADHTGMISHQQATVIPTVSKDAAVSIYLENHNTKGKAATIQLVRWSPTLRQVQAVLREFRQHKGRWFNKGFGYASSKKEVIAELTGNYKELTVIKAWDC